MKGTLALSWGANGGFYLHPRRVCLGRVALTLIPDVEIEDMMRAWCDVPELRSALADASQELDAAGCQVAASEAHRAAMKGLNA